MKRKIAFLLCTTLLLVGGIMGSSDQVQASGDYTNPELSITRVEDIDVYSNYVMNNLPFDNTIYNNQDGGQVYKVTLDEDGFVSLLLSARLVNQTVQTYSTRGSSSTSGFATLTATIYRDSKLLYPVAPAVTATGTVKGETLDKIALDQGTYYISINSPKYSSVLSGSTTTVVSVQGIAELLFYYQEVHNNETYRPSNIGNENQVLIEKEFVGLLTTTNPKDYYKFELTDKALVKLNFMYGSTKNLKFVLYSPEREELVTKTITGNSVWYNVEKFLEPGIYYCSLESITPYDGGLTNLLINQTVYPLKLTQKNGYTNSYITVETIDAPLEIRYVLGKLTNSELTSIKWNSAKVITEDLQFGVNKVGYYTVRVTDEYGNMFMQSIRVNSCDKKAPNKPTIKSYKAESLQISGTAEKNSIVTITVNNTIYTCTTSSKGVYKCPLVYKLVKGDNIEVFAQDISGNVGAKAGVIVK